MTITSTGCDTYDVAVSGAGLAGSSLALRLARVDVKVVLIDQGAFPRDKLCGEYLSPECWGVLGRLDLADDLERSGYQAIHSVRITTPRGREIVADVTGPDGRPGIGLSRSVLDDLIVRRAGEAGASVIERARVLGPIVEDGRVVGVRARGNLGEMLQVRSKVTVAADGRHSVLARQTGTTRGRSRFRPRLVGIKRHLAVEDASLSERPGTVGLHAFPGGYGGTCLVDHGLTNLCALLPEGGVRQRRGDLDAGVRAVLGRNPVLRGLLDSGVPFGGWKAVSGVRVEVSSPHIPGIFYVGDSHGTVDPLGGQGMTMALLGSERLASFVEACLVNNASDGFAIQRAWQREWHRRFDRRVHLCRAFHHGLIHPALIDSASLLCGLASRILSSCYHQTRDASGANG